MRNYLQYPANYFPKEYWILTKEDLIIEVFTSKDIDFDIENESLILYYTSKRKSFNFISK